ncbi:MBL fold metallo-hydrolase [Christensenellaceae bacterium NSJ-44]|uniref:MBL fold metallo-hydrolase n=1 Tax=Luoshenia tenuis TaxID=2763654 RepID=A0A926D0N8_9FIRM|nr:MBL fold metallo-hydrolase [Luoshenia tenuis]MBC8530200.1 MBL fold metallo-hydrolase [Luoshenia tenuis]
MLQGTKLIVDIADYRAQEGELAFWWLGQMGFIFKTACATLALDPYLDAESSKRRIPPLLAPEELVGVDYVFGSHDHSDHIDAYTWPRLAKASPHTRFIAPALFADALSARYGIARDRIIGLTDGQVFEDAEKKVKVTGVAAAHEFLDPDPDTGLYPSMSFIVESGGVRIFHAGDTCRYEGQESKLRAAGRFDVMILPINGRDAEKYRSNIIGNMDFREAVDLSGTLAPRLAIPGHYDMFPGNTADPIRFVDYMEAKYPAQSVWIGGHGQRFVLAKAR